jgi:hypothetical protein
MLTTSGLVWSPTSSLRPGSTGYSISTPLPFLPNVVVAGYVQRPPVIALIVRRAVGIPTHESGLGRPVPRTAL